MREVAPVRMRRARMPAATFALVLAAFITAGPALALSELKPLPAAPSDQLPSDQRIDDGAQTPTAPPLEGPVTGPDGGLPDPAPIIRQDGPPPDDAVVDLPDTPEDPGPLPEVVYDPTKLPAPAARMRQLIIEAAATGELEKLRMLLGSGPTATRLAVSEVDGDPVEYLKSVSGDAEGQEILAILLDVLSAGYVHVDAGTAEEMYVWPYFAAVPLEALKPAQRVELLRIVTAGDVDDMRAYGAYNFYRVGITPDGEWRLFLTGD